MLEEDREKEMGKGKEHEKNREGACEIENGKRHTERWSVSVC